MDLLFNEIARKTLGNEYGRRLCLKYFMRIFPQSSLKMLVENQKNSIPIHLLSLLYRKATLAAGIIGIATQINFLLIHLWFYTGDKTGTAIMSRVE